MCWCAMNPHATVFVPGGYAFDTTRKFVAKSATGVIHGWISFVYLFPHESVQ